MRPIQLLKSADSAAVVTLPHVQTGLISLSLTNNTRRFLRGLPTARHAQVGHPASMSCRDESGSSPPQCPRYRGAVPSAFALRIACARGPQVRESVGQYAGVHCSLSKFSYIRDEFDGA